MKLLLHTCCGPCFLGVWEYLATHEDIKTTLYYANPNIYPAEEWEKRLDNLRIVAKEKELILIESEYVPEQYFEAINSVIPVRAGTQREENGSLGLRPASRQGGPGMTTEIRCPHCYRLRLEETARYAKKNGYDAISTTLFVSPYQQHEALKNVIQDVAREYGVDFYYTDWRPFFREGQSMAKKKDIYRQKYCGCKFSLSDKTSR